MPFDLGAIVAKLVLDTGQFRSALAQAVSQAGNFGNQVSRATGVGNIGFGKLAGAIALAEIGVRNLMRVLDTIQDTMQGVFVGGLTEVERFRLTVIGLAAGIVSLDRTVNQMNVDQKFRDALAYSEDLFQQVLLLDAQFSGTAEELFEITRILAQHGILLDLNNEKQRQALRGFAEAVKALAPGLNLSLQATQAIRGILTGVRDEMDQVVRGLGLSGEAGEEFRKRMAAAADTTERAAVFAEELGKRVQGYIQAGAQLQNTLEATLSTLRTTANIIARAAFTEAWREVVRSVQEFVSLLRDAQGQLTPVARTIVEGLARGMDNVITALANFMSTLRDSAPDVSEIVAGVARVFGNLLALAIDIGSALTKWIVALRPVWHLLEAVINLATDLARILAIVVGKLGEVAAFVTRPFAEALDWVAQRLKLLPEVTHSTAEATKKAVADFLKSVAIIPPGIEHLERQRKEAIARVQREILELSGRTLDARLQQIEEERKKIIEKTGDEVLANRWAQAQIRKAYEETTDKVKSEQNKVVDVVRDAQQKILQMQGLTTRARLLQIEEETNRIRESTGNQVLAYRYQQAALAKLAEETQEKTRGALLDVLDFIARTSESSVTSTVNSILTSYERHRKALDELLKDERITREHHAAWTASLHLSTELEITKVFAKELDRRREELRRFEREYQSTLGGIVDIDRDIARLRALVWGRPESDILREEASVIRSALHDERLSLEQRVSLARDLESILERRIRALQAEGAAVNVIGGAESDLRSARLEQIDLLEMLRAKQSEQLREAEQKVNEAAASVQNLENVWKQVLDAMQGELQGAADRIRQVLVQQLPNEMYSEWVRVFRQIGQDAPGALVEEWRRRFEESVQISAQVEQSARSMRESVSVAASSVGQISSAAQSASQALQDASQSASQSVAALQAQSQQVASSVSQAASSSAAALQQVSVQASGASESVSRIGISAAAAQQQVSGAVSSMQADFGTLQSVVLTAVIGVLEEWKKRAEGLPEPVRNATNAILTDLQNLAVRIQLSLQNEVRPAVERVAAGIQNAFQRAWDGILEGASNAWRAVVQWFTVDLPAKIAEAAERIANFWRRIVGGAMDPTARHSPSMVDVVRSGMREIERVVAESARRIQRTTSLRAIAVGEREERESAPMTGVQIIINGQKLNVDARRALDLLDVLLPNPVQRSRVMRAIRHGSAY